MPTARATGKTAEKRTFRMHPKLLLDVIKRQAGSLAKAILEGVMNSVDAKCTRCYITMGASHVLIEDDGKGITDREQIELFFETFGQPHTEKEQKRYGTFRMGRGQMFAFGSNIWRTGEFEMTVDIKEKGLDYDLRSQLKPRPGCVIDIELYEPLLPSTIAETERMLRQWVKYVPAVIELNGEVLNVDPAPEKWDHITDEAYIRLTRGAASLSVYNLGVHVMDYPNHQFGVGGVVVSKEQLKVNFARNDVQHDCKVWRKVKPLIDQKAQAKLAKRPTLNEGEKQRLANLIMQGEPPANAKDLKLFTAVSGREFSAEQIYDAGYNFDWKITHAPNGSRIGDKVNQQKLAFVLADETLVRFGCKIEKLVQLLASLMSCSPRKYEIVKFSDLSATINEKYDLLKDDQLTLNERVWLGLASFCYYRLRLMDGNTRRNTERRRIVIGDSEVAEGWTDGSSYIAIGRKFLKKLTFDARGVIGLASLILHECCHDDADTGTHEHTQEFYESYHDKSVRLLPRAIDNTLATMPNAIKYAGKKMDRLSLRAADREASTLTALKGLVATLENKQKEAAAKE